MIKIEVMSIIPFMSLMLSGVFDDVSVERSPSTLLDEDIDGVVRRRRKKNRKRR